MIVTTLGAWLVCICWPTAGVMALVAIRRHRRYMRTKNKERIGSL